MPTAAQIGAGTTIGFTTVGGSSYTTVAEIVDAPTPSAKVNKVDATNYDSANVTEEYLPGFISPGETKIKANYLASNIGTVSALLRVKKDWKITFPDGVTCKFTGWISEFGVQLPIKDRITEEWSIQCTGVAVYAGGS